MSFTQVFWCDNVVGVIIDPIITLIEDALDAGDSGPTCVVTTHLGFPAVLMERGTAPNDTRWIYVWTGATGDEVCPVRECLNQPGMQLELGWTYGPDYTPSGWAVISGIFTTVGMPKLVELLNAFTNGLILTPSFYTVDYAGGVAHSLRCVIPIQTPSETLVFTAAITGQDSIFPDTYAYRTGRKAAQPGSAPPQDTTSQSMIKIAKALDVMSRTTRVTWINNQGGFADIMTGDIVTEGGEG